MEESNGKVTSDDSIKKTFDDTLKLTSDLKQHLRLIPAQLKTLKENGNAEVIQQIMTAIKPFIEDLKEIDVHIPKVEVALNELNTDVQFRNTSGRTTQQTDSGIGSYVCDEHSVQNGKNCTREKRQKYVSRATNSTTDTLSGIQDTNPPNCTDLNIGSLVLFENCNSDNSEEC